MPFTGLINTQPTGGSQNVNGDNGTVNLFPSQICSGVSTAQVTGISNVPTLQGVQSGVGHDMLSGARKRPRDISFGQMSNYGGLQTSSSFVDKITMMIRKQQIETDCLIEENEKKLRMELAERQAQQVKQLLAVVHEENLEKLKLKNDEVWRMGKNNYFLNEKVKSLIQEKQSLMNSVVTHEATITSLQAKLLEVLDSERRLLEANVTAQGTESCCGSNNINVDQVDHSNVIVMDQDGYDVGNNVRVINQDGNNGHVMNQGGYDANDGGQNINQVDFVIGDVGCIKDEGVFGGGADGYLPDKYKCKSCGEREASVMVLPCRHLCLCPVCETRLRYTCPVCEVPIESSFYVNSS